MKIKVWQLFFIVSVLDAATIGILWILGIIQKDIANDLIGRTMGVLVLISVSMGLILWALDRGKTPAAQNEANKSDGSSRPNQGPTFS